MNIMDMVEPAARALLDSDKPAALWTREDVVKFSIAISLRRIADALEIVDNVAEAAEMAEGDTDKAEAA